MAYFVGDTEDKDALKEREEYRLAFYKAVVELIRAYNAIGGEMEKAGFTKEKAEKIKQQVLDYTDKRNVIKNASGDYIDLKKHEPEMRQLLDMYLVADPSRVLSNLGESTLLELIVKQGVEEATKKLPEGIKNSQRAMAETLEANMRKVIIQEMPINPAYYEKMSTLLTELVHQRKIAAIDYEKYLKKIEELAKKVQPKDADERQTKKPAMRQYSQTASARATKPGFGNSKKP
jgi:type I restriction enzyme R subunit